MSQAPQPSTSPASADSAPLLPAIVVPVHVYDRFFQRLRGLLGRPAPNPGQAVFLTPCSAVHTFAMAYPIDVIHLDRQGIILCTQTLRPYRLGRYFAESVGVLEMRAGEATRLGLVPGKKICLEPLSSDV